MNQVIGDAQRGRRVVDIAVHVRHRGAGLAASLRACSSDAGEKSAPVIAAPSRASESASVPMWHRTCTPRSPATHGRGRRTRRCCSADWPYLAAVLGVNTNTVLRTCGCCATSACSSSTAASASGVVGYVALRRQRRRGPVGAGRLAGSSGGVIDAVRRRQGPPRQSTSNVRDSGLPRRPRFAADCGHAGRHALRSN